MRRFSNILRRRASARLELLEALVEVWFNLVEIPISPQPMRNSFPLSTFRGLIGQAGWTIYSNHPTLSSLPRKPIWHDISATTYWEWFTQHIDWVSKKLYWLARHNRPSPMVLLIPFKNSPFSQHLLYISLLEYYTGYGKNIARRSGKAMGCSTNLII